MYLNWDITNKCNLACTFCYNSNYVNSYLTKAISMSESFLDSVFAKLKRLGITRVMIGGGEPLLAENLIPSIEQIYKHGIVSGITTNCTLMTKKIASKLLKAGLSSLTCSLDAGRAELHDKIRGKGMFDKALLGLMNFIEESKKEEVEPLIGIVTTLSPEIITTEEDILEIMYLADSIGVDTLEFNYVMPVGKGYYIAKKLTGAYVYQTGNWIGKNAASFPDIHITLSTKPLISNYFVKKYKSKNFVKGQFSCAGAEKMIMMTQDMFIYPCYIFWDNDFFKRNIKDYFNFDKQDLYIEDVKDLKSLPLFKQFLEAKRNYKKNVPSLCRDCEFVDECRGICRMHALSKTKEINEQLYLYDCLFFKENIIY